MKKGFTLVELIVVVVVLGLLASIVVPNISSMKGKSIIAMVNSNIRNFQTAVDIYALEHNGVVPTTIQPTIGEPQLIQMNELYPNYLKTLPKEDTISKQNYWVDYTGKVWGATIDSPSNVYVSDESLEWSNQIHATGYNVYQVKDKVTSAVNNSKTFSLKKEILLSGSSDKVKFEIGQENSDYLLSAIDQYGLETAPVNLDYEGKGQGEPILMQEGEFYYEINSEDTLYWDDFKAIEDKPAGTDIEYSFAVSDDPNDLNNFISDFSSLTPAKHMRIKIHMISHEGKYPSLYDLRVFYHYADDVVLTSKRVSQSGNMVVDEVKLANDQYVDQIHLADSYEYGNKPSSTYTYSPNGSAYYPVTSLSNIPSGSYIHVEREGTNVTFKDPIVTASTSSPVVQNETASGNAGGGSAPAQPDSELQDKSWETFQTLTFFASAADGQLTHWIRAEIVDNQPENTRILYRYSVANNSGFGPAVDDISKVSDSRTLRVMAYLQVKKEEKSQTDRSSVTSIKIVHSRGVVDLNTVKPTGTILANKSNNANTDSFSVDTKVTWDYDAFDPQGKKVVEVVWGGDKRDQYTTPGTYTVTLKLRNELNYWSDTITYKFDVKEEKPVAVLKPDQSQFSSKIPIVWDTTSSYDPDGDGISKVEWGGDYKTDNRYAPGTHIVKLRVQDKEGNWSPWVEKTFVTVNSIFMGIDVKAIDEDMSTAYAVSTWNHDFWWEGDLSNKVVSITGYRPYEISSYYGYIRVLNAAGQEIPFINATTGEVVNEIQFTTTVATYNFVMPPEGVKIRVGRTSGNAQTTIYDVRAGDELSVPSDVTNVSSTSKDTEVTLQWATSSDIAKVAIYRDGVFKGFSTTGTFTDKPLYSDTTYNYTLKAVGTNGNFAKGVSYVAKTIRPSVVWSGLSAVAFDHDMGTYHAVSALSQTFTWTGDISNRVVSISGYRPSEISSYYGYIRVLNAAGQEISFINADTGAVVSEIAFTTSLATFNFIMPTAGTSIKVGRTSGNSQPRIYEVSVGDDLSLPNNVSAISSTETDVAVNLSWSNPNGVSKVAIYRDGVFRSFVTGTTYTDKPLRADTSYVYTIRSVGTNGNFSTGATYTVKTVRPEVVFTGLSNEAFDHDNTTFYTVNGTSEDFTWSGDVSNKIISISGYRPKENSSYYGFIRVVNAAGTQIPFINANTGASVNELQFTTSIATYKFILPADAKAIRVGRTSGNTKTTIYDVEVLNQ